MNNSEHLAELLESLKQGVGVLSTRSEDGGIDSAVVYFICDKNLNIYFFTRMNSRKYKSILANSNVSFVVYSEDLMQTFQYKGDASLIEDPLEQKNAFEELFKIANARSGGHPPLAQMMDSEIAVMKVNPLWARFSNFSLTKDEEKIVELKTN